MVSASDGFRMVQLPRGPAGIDATLFIMRNVVRAQAAHPDVRNIVLKIVEGIGAYAGAERADAILEWVRSHMGFVPDPVDVEALTVPSMHIRNIVVHGRTSGDCDDGAVLIATLARAVGLRTQFVAASFVETGRLHHVWAEAFDGGWIPLDPFRAETFGGQETARKVVPI